MKLRFAKNLGALGCVTAVTLSGLAQTASPLAALPLFFEANHGQTASTAPFLARTADAQCTISASGVEMNLRRHSGQTAQLLMNFVGANPAAVIHGEAGLTGKVNYLLGNDPAQWRSGVETFAKVCVEKIYPGVDVIFYGNQQQLEYDFNIAAGVDPKQVALRFGGAEKIQLSPAGELVISVGGGEIRQPQPVIYQTVNGVRHPVRGGYEIVSAQTVAFQVGEYDHALPLVIDPVLSYSTYFGGNAGETALGVAVDASGFVYVAGKTFSSAITNKIPWSTTGAFQTNYHGGTFTGDAFVAKFDNFGTNLVYMTYLGGKSDDGADGVAIDASGNAYIAGYTSSTDFPVTNILSGSGIATNLSGKSLPGVGYLTDVFIAELSADGSRLIYSGLLGGNAADAAMGIAVDPATGTAFITGYTYSTNFPVTANAWRKKLACPNSLYYNANGFMAAIAPGGAKLDYSTYLGGTNFDMGMAIAYNNANVFVAGFTSSTNFPTTNFIPGYRLLNGSTNKNNSAADAFVTAFTVSSGTNLTPLYSTLLGGTNGDIAFGIAADTTGNAYVVGSTTSTNFPYTNALASFGTNSPSYVRTNATGAVLATNAFLTQIRWNGTNAAIGYSAMFGGRGIDVATAVALDAATGNAYVTGYASSTNFPVLTNNLTGFPRATNSGGSDAFVTVFTADASALLYSTYLGGRSGDFGYAIAVDPAGAAYVVGQTLSTNFATLDARQTFRNGTNDSFLAKISLDMAPVMTLVPQDNSIHPKLGGEANAASGATLQLAWRMFPPTYALECSTNFNNTDSWSPAPWPTAYSNGWFNASVPATNGSQFFRLRKF